MDHNKVLVINKAWFPIEIIDYKDCFRLLAKEHAKALETIDSTYVTHTLASWMDSHMHEKYDKVNTTSMEIPVPEIIVLTDYDSVPKHFINFSKQNLLIRDNYTCAYCRGEVDGDSATIDHVHPQSKGGATSWENCVIACRDCNHKKADKLPFGTFKPNFKAKEPSGSGPMYRVTDKVKRMKYPDSWEAFLMKS